MDNDDRTIGTILGRRDALRLLSAAGISLVALPVDAATETNKGSLCVVRPETIEGPYFVDQQLNRSDIRIDPSDNSVVAGVPLTLTLNVAQVDGAACRPLAGAIVDVWQCDTQGVYSDVRDQIIGYDTIGKKYLRGHQVTGADGRVRFQTIYPGWYKVRTVHVHVKVRTTTKDKKAYEFTSQLYFDDALTDKVHALPAYSARGRRPITNATDMYYGTDGGRQMTLALRENRGGYETSFDIGLDLSDDRVGASDRMKPGPPPGAPPVGAR